MLSVATVAKEVKDYSGYELFKIITLLIVNTKLKEVIKMKGIMTLIVIGAILFVIITLTGCGEAHMATLEPVGVETILTEEIIVEEIHVEPIHVTSYEDVTTYWAD